MKFESHWPKGSGGVSFKANYSRFSIFSSGGHLVYWSGTVLAILLGSYRGNITMKFESHWPKGSGGVSFKANYSRFSIFSSGGHFVHRSQTI